MGIFITCGAILPGYRKVLVSTGSAISLLFKTEECRNHFSAFGSISGTVGSFQSGGAFAGQQAMTIKLSLVMASSRSRNMNQRRFP